MKRAVANGFIIEEYSIKEQSERGYKYGVFTQDEYSQGYGLRAAEWETDNLNEAINWAKS